VPPQKSKDKVAISHKQVLNALT